jgi:hypothetical protein
MLTVDYLVAVRLAGVSDFQGAPAGKPCCYGNVVDLLENATRPTAFSCPASKQA